MSVQKAARLEVRLSVHEREAIEAKAKSLGMSLSDYVRLAALGFSTGQQVSIPEPAAAVIARRLRPPSRAVQPRGDQTQRYRCPRDCNPGWRPTSSTVKCDYCRSEVVPA